MKPIAGDGSSGHRPTLPARRPGPAAPLPVAAASLAGPRRPRGSAPHAAAMPLRGPTCSGGKESRGGARTRRPRSGVGGASGRRPAAPGARRGVDGRGGGPARARASSRRGAGRDSGTAAGSSCVVLRGARRARGGEGHGERGWVRSRAGPGAHLCVGLPGPGDALERGAGGVASSLCQRLRRAPGGSGHGAGCPRPPGRRLTRGGGAPPRRPPPAGFIPAHGARRARFFLGSPALRFASPGVPAAVGPIALSGRRAVLSAEPRSGCERCPRLPLSAAGHAEARDATGPSPRTVPRRWLVRHPPARALFPPSPASARCRGSPRPAPLPRSLRCRSPFAWVSSPGGREVRSSRCHSGDGLDPPERATRGLRDRALIGTSPRPRAPTPLTRFRDRAEEGEAPGRGIARRALGAA